MLANQVGYLTSVMKSELFNFSTSSSIAAHFSLPTLRFLWDTGFTMESMVRRWQSTLASIPNMSASIHMNKLTFLLNKVTNSSSSASDREVPSLIIWKSRNLIWTSFRSFVGLFHSSSLSYDLNLTSSSLTCLVAKQQQELPLLFLFQNYSCNSLGWLLGPPELPQFAC